MFGSLRPEGWNPRLRVPLRGPVPAGAELVWSVARPDGSPWFEHRVPVPELDDQQTTVIDLQRWIDGGDLAEPGMIAFTLRMTSALEGVDVLLHTGSLTAVALDGEQRYAIDNDWMLGLGLLCLDAVDEYDAPRLTATLFLKGAVDPYQLEAHCFHEGRRIARATFVDNRYSFTANDGTVVGQEVTVVFDGVRGWNNLRDSGWGADWHFLDENDGAYQLKLLREAAMSRVIDFAVSGGRITATGAIEDDAATGPVLLVDAAVEGALDGARRTGGAPAFYGDAVTAASWASLDAVYARRIEAAASGPAVDPETTVELQAFVDRAERLLATWESGFVGVAPRSTSGRCLPPRRSCANRPTTPSCAIRSRPFLASGRSWWYPSPPRSAASVSGWRRSSPRPRIDCRARRRRPTTSWRRFGRCSPATSWRSSRNIRPTPSSTPPRTAG